MWNIYNEFKDAPSEAENEVASNNSVESSEDDLPY